MKTLHRILTPLMALAIFPIAFLLPMFRMMVAAGFAASQGGTKTNLLDSFGLGEYITLKDLIMIAKDGDNQTISTIKSIWAALKPESQDQIIKTLSGWQWGVVFAVILAIILILALALIIISAATKKPVLSVILSGVGIILAIAMNGSFNMFAKPFLSGAVNLSSLLGNTNALMSLLLGNAVSVDYMKLGIAYPAIILTFVAILIFSIAAYVEQKNEN